MKTIQDLWIMKKSGVVIFKKVYKEKINQQLLGALISAITTIAEKLVGDIFESFSVDNIKYTLKNENGIIFIANSDSKAKDKQIQKELKIISQKFFKKYSIEQIHSKECDISRFDEFRNEIDNISKNNIEKFLEKL